MDGEYATSRATPEAEPTVRLTIRVTQGDRRSEVVSSGPLTEAEAGQPLGETPPAGAGRQRLQLESRAAGSEPAICPPMPACRSLSEMGHWPQATGLREAALLLQPQQVDQRLRLIRDYRQWAPGGFRWTGKPNARDTQSGSTPPPRRSRKTADGSRRVSPASGPQHRDGRRRRQPHPYDAAELLRVIRQHGWIETRDGLETPPELVEEQRRLFWSVALRLRVLDASAPQRFNDVAVPCPRCYSWQGVVLGIVLEDLAIRIQFVVEGPRGERRPKKVWDDRDTLEDLYRLLTEVLPQDTLDPDVSPEDGQQLRPGAVVREGRVTAEEANRFCGRLMERTDPPTNSRRCGILALKAHRPEDPGSDADEAKGADELLTYFARKVGTEFGENDLEYTSGICNGCGTRPAAKPAWRWMEPGPAPTSPSHLRVRPAHHVSPGAGFNGLVDTYAAVWVRVRLDVGGECGLRHAGARRGQADFFSVFDRPDFGCLLGRRKRLGRVGQNGPSRLVTTGGRAGRVGRFGRELPPCNPGVADQLHPAYPASPAVAWSWAG